MSNPIEAYNIADLRDIAQKKLPRGVFEFMDRGTEDEVSLRNNRAVFEKIRLKPRVLVNIAKRTQAIDLFGNTQKMPMVIAPTGFAGLLWYEGEIALARAAADAGIPFTLATGSLTPMEKVAQQAGGELWFQLYMWPDRSLSHQLVERARIAGFKALIVTVDGVVSGNREFNLRNGFTVPFSFTRRNVTDVLMHPGWLTRVLAKYMLTTGMPRYANYPSEIKYKVTTAPMGRSQMKNETLNWDDLRHLRKIWPHKLLVKGLLHADDAELAVQCGADGVIVSNHGGRNLDGAISPMEALPEVVNAVGKRVTVLIDSGFRRGSDVVKALALGANAVQIGRPGLYGIAAAGQYGAERALTIFREEISRVMALLGCNSVAELSRAYLQDAEPTLRTGSQHARPELRVVEGH